MSDPLFFQVSCEALSAKEPDKRYVRFPGKGNHHFKIHFFCRHLKKTRFLTKNSSKFKFYGRRHHRSFNFFPKIELLKMGLAASSRVGYSNSNVLHVKYEYGCGVVLGCLSHRVPLALLAWKPRLG